MNILFVIPSLSIRTGGPAFSSIEYAREMQRLGESVRILTTNALFPANSRARKSAATISDFPADAANLPIFIANLNRPLRFAYSRELKSLIETWSVWADVIQIHSLNLYPQFATWQTARRLRRPFLVTPHGALDPYILRRHALLHRMYGRLWQDQMLKDAAMIHFTSGDERALAMQNVSIPRSIVLPNGLDLGTFSAATDSSATRTRLLAGRSGPLIVNHGRISRKKGLDILVQAAPLIRLKYPNSRIVFVGPDDEGLGSVLLKEASRLSVADMFGFEGLLNGAELRSAIASADVWVLPSHSENFGNAMVEAMATGRPVVTSRHVNIALDAQQNGACLIADIDPEDVAAKVLALLDSEELSSSIGNNARRWSAQFDWNALAPQYQAMYREVATTSISAHR